MTDIVSKELCQELYEVSAWKQLSNYEPHWVQPANNTKAQWSLVVSLKELDGWLLDHPTDRKYYKTVPAYTAGYLLRRLQEENLFPILTAELYSKWWCKYGYLRGSTLTRPAKEHAVANTPEDALAKLAIELFKQGVLTKEGNSNEQ